MIEDTIEKKVFISDASGRLGRAVLKTLPDAIPLVRTAAGLPNEVVTDFSLESLKPILERAKAVVHLAGSLDFNDKETLWQGNAELTRRIAQACPPTCKIILASSISVYGKKLAQIPANELTPCKPDSEYAKSKFMAEQIVASHPEHVILRIGTVYGPQFGDYLVLLKKVEEGKMMVIGDGKNRIPFVHVDDVAKAIANSVGKGSGVYLLAGDLSANPLTQEGIFKVAADALHVDPPSRHVSFTLSWWFAWLRNRFGKKGFTTEHIAILGSDRVFDCIKANEELGFAPRPLEQGIREMVKVLKGW